MATNTTATSQTHNGNGSTATFAISFSFLENTEVDVTVGGVLKTLGTHYNISGSSVTFTSGNIPPSGTANIKFQRDTNISTKKVDFADGSVLTETDLDNNSDQILFAQQEITDKLSGIEEGATGDQTDAEIKTAYENNSDTNAFTDALLSKLNGIEAGATADQTNAEIRAAVEAASDSNVFTDNDHTKLNNIEDNATADQTVTEIKSLIAGSPLDASHLAANSVDTSELADDAVTNAKIADAELKTLATMQSGTASKLADSTALTSDIADLNQLDGMQKATSITDDDTKFPTSGAIVEYVAAQLAPIGGLEAIANESSFPNTQPQSGVVISIADAGGMAVSSTGTASGTTVGGTSVNISGIATNFRGASVAAGIRFLVVSTGAGQNYTYHKATLKEDDLVGLSGDINDFAERYRVGSSNPTTNNDAGDLFFNTSTGKLMVYNGTTSAWEEAQSVGNFFISTLSPAFDGSTTNFTITNAPTSAQQILLIIEGVIQKPNAGTSTPTEGFALDSSTVKLAAAPAVGASYHAVVMGSTVNIGTPSDNTVTTAILQNNSVSTQKIQDEAITLAKLEHGTSSNDGKFLRANNGADPTFETVNTDLVSDTSPQLGGNLDTNGFNISLDDQRKLKLGTGEEYEIYNDSSNLIIDQIQDGLTTFIRSKQNGNITVDASDTGNQVAAKFKFSNDSTPVSSVELYHGGVKKAETVTSGFTVTGTLTATAYAGDGSGLTGVSSQKADGCVTENSQTISNNYTMGTNKSGISAGPITIANNVTVNIPSVHAMLLSRG